MRLVNSDHKSEDNKRRKFSLNKSKTAKQYINKPNPETDRTGNIL